MLQSLFPAPAILCRNLWQKSGLIVPSLVIWFDYDAMLSHFPLQGFLAVLKVHQKRYAYIQLLDLFFWNWVKPVVLKGRDQGILSEDGWKLGRRKRSNASSEVFFDFPSDKNGQMVIRQCWGIGRKGLSVQFGDEYVEAVFAVLLGCFRVWVHNKYSSIINSDLYSIHDEKCTFELLYQNIYYYSYEPPSCSLDERVDSFE